MNMDIDAGEINQPVLTRDQREEIHGKEVFQYNDDAVWKVDYEASTETHQAYHATTNRIEQEVYKQLVEAAGGDVENLEAQKMESKKAGINASLLEIRVKCHAYDTSTDDCSVISSLQIFPHHDMYNVRVNWEPIELNEECLAEHQEKLRKKRDKRYESLDKMLEQNKTKEILEDALSDRDREIAELKKDCTEKDEKNDALEKAGIQKDEKNDALEKAGNEEKAKSQKRIQGLEAENQMLKDRLEHLRSQIGNGGASNREQQVQPIAPKRRGRPMKGLSASQQINPSAVPLQVYPQVMAPPPPPAALQIQTMLPPGPMAYRQQVLTHQQMAQQLSPAAFRHIHHSWLPTLAPPVHQGHPYFRRQAPPAVTHPTPPIQPQASPPANDFKSISSLLGLD